MRASAAPTTAAGLPFPSQMATDSLSSASDSDSNDTQQACLFFEPPPEIRVRIYEYAFSPDTDDDPVENGQLKHDGDCAKFSCVTRENWRTRSALLQACQLIRQEALPVFYKSTSFHLSVNKQNYTSAAEWLDEIGKEQNKLIPRLCISWEPTEKTRNKFIALKNAREEASARRQQNITLLKRGLARGWNCSLFSSESIWKVSSKLKALQHSESEVQAGVAHAFAHGILTSGVCLEAVLLDSTEDDPFEVGDRYIDEVRENFMLNLGILLFPPSYSDDDDCD